MTALDKAFVEWLKTVEGIKCADAWSLGAPFDQKQFIAHRLRRAFEAGWYAATTEPKENL